MGNVNKTNDEAIVKRKKRVFFEIAARLDPSVIKPIDSIKNAYEEEKEDIKRFVSGEGIIHGFITNSVCFFDASRMTSENMMSVFANRTLYKERYEEVWSTIVNAYINSERARCIAPNNRRLANSIVYQLLFFDIVKYGSPILKNSINNNIDFITLIEEEFAKTKESLKKILNGDTDVSHKDIAIISIADMVLHTNAVFRVGYNSIRMCKNCCDKYTTEDEDDFYEPTRERLCPKCKRLKEINDSQILIEKKLKTNNPLENTRYEILVPEFSTLEIELEKFLRCWNINIISEEDNVVFGYTNDKLPFIARYTPRNSASLYIVHFLKESYDLDINSYDFDSEIDKLIEKGIW